MLFLMFALAVATPESATSPSPQASSSMPVASLTPMPEAEMAKTLQGCLDEHPYPADVGPLCFSRDGHYRQLSGWGTIEGQYTIEANHIALCERKTSQPCVAPIYLTFYCDQKGQIYYHYGIPKPAQLARPLKMGTAQDLQR